MAYLGEKGGLGLGAFQDRVARGGTRGLEGRPGPLGREEAPGQPALGVPLAYQERGVYQAFLALRGPQGHRVPPASASQSSEFPQTEARPEIPSSLTPSWTHRGPLCKGRWGHQGHRGPPDRWGRRGLWGRKDLLGLQD